MPKVATIAFSELVDFFSIVHQPKTSRRDFTYDEKLELGE
jgi:hypothetical protein